jgi:pimeloyl-ACP methyl ester carboxylesterase
MADPEWIVMAARAHCKYAVPGMDAVEVHPHLSYATRDGVTQRYDQYGAAPGCASKVVLLVHGGPIPDNLHTTPVDWGLFQSLARLLAASGIVAVMFNHRFFSLDSAPTAMNDIEDLMSHLGAERVCLWVFSGGGSLLARVLRNTPASVQCVVAYYAALAAQTSEFSAVDAIEENVGRIPPILVARAGLDRPQLNEAIDRFIAVALRKNATIDVMNHPTGQHGFDFRDDNERTREILARTVEFIQTSV